MSSSSLRSSSATNCSTARADCSTSSRFLACSCFNSLSPETSGTSHYTYLPDFLLLSLICIREKPCTSHYTLLLSVLFSATLSHLVLTILFLSLFIVPFSLIALVYKGSLTMIGTEECHVEAIHEDRSHSNPGRRRPLSDRPY